MILLSPAELSGVLDPLKDLEGLIYLSLAHHLAKNFQIFIVKSHTHTENHIKQVYSIMWNMPIIPVLERRRQKTQEFKASFDYTEGSKPTWATLI